MTWKVDRLIRSVGLCWGLHAHCRSLLSPTLLPLSHGCPSAASADLDADGDVDCVVGTATGELQLLINNGRGDFTNQAQARGLPVNISSGVAVTMVRMADLVVFGGLADMDVMVALANGTVAVFANNGSGCVARAQGSA